MKLKYLFLISISLPLSECYYRVCAARAVLKTDIDELKESVKFKDKLKNCGEYPCAKAFLKLENNKTNKSFSLDVRDCLIEYPCNDDEYDNEGDWEK
uniref:Uncharacterized protein n=1 Tax=Strongyloides papillosus TaxID=174720 RepID=A0A0N5CBD6_STREA